MQKNTLEQFTTSMRACHLKITRARTEVFRILADADQPLLPKQVVARAAQADPSSVYRALSLFARHKIARRVSRGFKTLYELGDAFSHHQHYVICERCGRSVKFKNLALERLAHQITRAAGMKPTGHLVELVGVCAGCQRCQLPVNSVCGHTKQ
ncbi:MAG: transcriptional repressor [Candidatus Nomurabacteria bacterium]|nr:transcriptional repressor [Candidatus Nomurabacteria bacterium]